MTRTGLLIGMFYLTACSTLGSSNTFAPAIIDDGRADIYIYRPASMPNAIYAADLYVNDELKLTVKNGKNNRLQLAPGVYEFEIKSDINQQTSTRLTLQLKPDTIYFIRIDTTLKIKSATDYEPYQRSFSIVLVEENIAKLQIADCCVTKPDTVVNKSETKPLENTADEGFSVDKTQDPFSH